MQCALPLIAVIVGAAMISSTGAARAQQSELGDNSSVELVDQKVLRVCADPASLPYSNQAGEGFENKLAELMAQKLGKSLAYTWYPQSPGFVRNTLRARKCDVIMGMPQGGDLVTVTNAYYRTAYAIAFKPGTGLDGVESLEDPRLKTKKIGIVAGTPPATNLAVNGLIGNAKPYTLVVDTRVENSPRAMMNDLASGEIDAAVLWGPFAGYYAKQSATPVTVVPLVKETNGPKEIYRIGMGIRGADIEWKRQLNKLTAELQPEINALLLSYGMPLLDENEKPLAQ
jgi:quinoprotein dehydrogenase-associated probable ABC transporter substrate-binding protein